MPRASDPNRCSVSERAIINPDRRPTARADRGGGSREPGRSVLGKRTLADEDKLDIFKHYSGWAISGHGKADSPIPMLCKTYACNSQYPKRLYDKAASATEYSGRAPSAFSEKVWDQMIVVIREQRKQQKRASGALIAARLAKKARGKKTPSSGLSFCQLEFAM